MTQRRFARGPSSSGQSAARTFTPEEVAQLAKVHPETVRRLARAKRIKAVKITGFWRIPSEEVDRMLANGI